MVDSLPPFPTRENGDVRIKILELFKGDAVDTLYEPSVNTSCDLGIRVGQQWLFFGQKGDSGRMEIGICNFTVKYRSSQGLRDWTSFSGQKELLMLRKIFNKETPAPYAQTVQYPNGQREMEQSFRNGKLHGKRRIFYPGGQLHVLEKFRRGKRVGYRRVYSPSGQVWARTTYSGGRKKTFTTWFDRTNMDGILRFQAIRMLRKEGVQNAGDLQITRVTDSLRRAALSPPVATSFRFRHAGRSYHYRTFHPGGSIYEDTYLNWKDKTYTSREYDEAGRLQNRVSYSEAKLTSEASPELIIMQ